MYNIDQTPLHHGHAAAVGIGGGGASILPPPRRCQWDSMALPVWNAVAGRRKDCGSLTRLKKYYM